MRSFAFLLSLQSLSHCTGFSPVKTPTHLSSPSRSALSAARDGPQADLQRKAANIAATLALGWAVGASASLAAPSLSNDWSPASSSSSSFVVSLSESDFADFSLPSYEDVNAAAINTNLKGGKQLFGEAAIEAASSSPGEVSTPAVEEKKEPTAAELKADKVAAKAAAKAARERQQAAVEAAAKN